MRSPSFAMFRSLYVVAVVVVPALVACSGGGDEPATTTLPATGQAASSACAPYDASGSDLGAPASFTNDVMPIFQRSCAFSSCHGASSRRVALAGDPATVHSAIVGVPAGEAPRLSFVAPGDPAKSFLMHKLDGDLCAIASECNGGECQRSMPQGSSLLPTATRDVIRRWIAQGAKAD